MREILPRKEGKRLNNACIDAKSTLDECLAEVNRLHKMVRNYRAYVMDMITMLRTGEADPVQIRDAAEQLFQRLIAR